MFDIHNLKIFIFFNLNQQAQKSLGSCDELYSPSKSSLNVMDRGAYSLLEPLIAVQMSYLLTWFRCFEHKQAFTQNISAEFLPIKAA